MFLGRKGPSDKVDLKRTQEACSGVFGKEPRVEARGKFRAVLTQCSVQVAFRDAGNPLMSSMS